uniref:Uncharacterized protein n=1 Tax=Phalansterium sp. PJK-2012 TaxID=1267188 RepID=T1QDX8_9EUKA|nr:hypothetical protein [Phalansterium sp. PJK-2012]
MKVNYYKFEKNSFLDRLNENITYDLLYASSSPTPYAVGIDFVTLSLDTRNVSEYELGSGPYFLRSLTHQRARFREKSTAYKVTQSLASVQLRGVNLSFFLDRMLRKVYPILRKKLVSVSKNINYSSQWIQTLADFNLYFRFGFKYGVQNWNQPVHICYFMKGELEQASYYLILMGYLFRNK